MNREEFESRTGFRLSAAEYAGDKVSYIVASLAERYHVCERKVYALVKRYGSDCNCLIKSSLRYFGGLWRLKTRCMGLAADFDVSMEK